MLGEQIDATGMGRVVEAGPHFEGYVKLEHVTSWGTRESLGSNRLAAGAGSPLTHT